MDCPIVQMTLHHLYLSTNLKDTKQQFKDEKITCKTQITNSLAFNTKITELWKDIENSSCYHIQKRLLDTPTFVTISTVRHSMPLMYSEIARKVDVSSIYFWVW